MNYGCQKLFFLIGIKTLKRITLEVSPAFSIIIQLYTTFTILSIHSKEMIIIKEKRLEERPKPSY